MRTITSTRKFSQRIKYDRSSDIVSGYLYAGSKPVSRCIMVTHSDQFSDKQFNAFITSNTRWHGKDHAGVYAFDTLEEALAFAKNECQYHILVNDAEYFETDPTPCVTRTQVPMLPHNAWI